MKSRLSRWILIEEMDLSTFFDYLGYALIGR